MSKITNPNALRMIDALHKDLANALDQPLFGTNPERVSLDGAIDTSSLLSSLNELKGQGGIKTFEVGRVHISTWETLYPNMYTRHLAIEAYAAYGSVIYTTEDPGFPYEKKVSIFIVSPEGWKDYVGEEHSLDVDSLELSEGETILRSIYYEMELPGAMKIDVFIKPAQPIKMIKLSGVITSSGATFDESVST